MKKKLFYMTFTILSAVLLIFITGCVKEEEDSKGIKIAALMPLSGELGSKGEIRKIAIEKGIEDANAKFKEKEMDVKFNLTVEDSKSDPDEALKKAKKLWEKGYKIFIASSSAEVEKLMPWAKENGAIVLSGSSTSPSLGVAGDGVFRLVPDDTQQAAALASLLEFEGIYGIVPIYRDDVYGRELVDLLTKEFKNVHGIVSDPIKYQPKETKWDEILTNVSKSIDNLKLEKNRIAVVLVSFDEIGDILQASEKVEGLNEVRWFGTDTVALSPVILKDEKIAKIADKVKLTGVTFGIPDSELFETLQNEFKSNDKWEFLPDAFFAYDIPLMLATVVSQLEDPFNTEDLMNKMIEGSGIYAGVTGWTLLNEKGDRTYYHYDIWEVQKKDDHYEWNKTAKYLRNPGLPGFVSPIDFKVESEDKQ